MIKLLTTFATFIGAIIGIIGLFFIEIVYIVMSTGFVVYSFIHWFLIPLIPILVITYKQSIGIGYIIHLFKPKLTSKLYLKDIEIESKSITWMIILSPWIIWLSGYIFHQYFYN